MLEKRHLALKGTSRKGRSDVAVAAGWQLYPLTRAHGCKEQRSGLTTQDRRAPPARATNPRTGGHRPKKRHFMTGIPAVTFIPEARRFRVRGRAVRRDFTFILAEVSCLWCPTACRSGLGIAVLAIGPSWLSRLGYFVYVPADFRLVLVRFFAFDIFSP